MRDQEAAIYAVGFESSIRGMVSALRDGALSFFLQWTRADNAKVSKLAELEEG